MKFKQTLQVMQASKYDMEGNKGGNLFAVGEPCDEPNRHGQDILKIKAEYDLIEQLRGQLPAQVELELSISQGGGQKAQLTAHSAKVIGPTPSKAA